MSNVSTELLLFFAICNALTALGAAALQRKGAGNGEIAAGGAILGPALILAFLTSDKRPVCATCKERNPAGVRFCNNCAMQFRA